MPLLEKKRRYKTRTKVYKERPRKCFCDSQHLYALEKRSNFSHIFTYIHYSPRFWSDVRNKTKQNVMKQERTEKGNSHLLTILQIPHSPYMVCCLFNDTRVFMKGTGTVWVVACGGGGELNTTSSKMRCRI